MAGEEAEAQEAEMGEEEEEGGKETEREGNGNWSEASYKPSKPTSP